MKPNTWRSFIIVATIGLALFYLFPTYQFYFSPPSNPDQLESVKQKSINLGLDLQGGIHLVLEVDPSKLSEDDRSDWAEELELAAAQPLLNPEIPRVDVANLPTAQPPQHPAGGEFSGAFTQ